MGPLTEYIRSVLVATLIEHQRLETGGCSCGFDTIGASFANHVATEYEQRMGYQYLYNQVFCDG